MTRIGVALLALMWAGLALAGDFNAKAASAEWYHAHMECRLPIEGQTDQQADEQCKRRDALTIALKAHAFCFDVSEQEWGKCRVDQE